MTVLSLKLTSTHRRAVVAAVGLAAAACSDAGTAPQSATVSPSLPTSGAQADLRTPRPPVTVRVKDAFGILIIEKPYVKFVWGTDSTVIQDNTPGDSDFNPGIITVSLPSAASYKACLYKDTKTFGIDTKQSICNSVVGGTATVDLGTLTMHHFPLVYFLMRDADDLSLWGGATMKLVAPPTDGFSMIANDGGSHDFNGVNDGNLQMLGNRPGLYTWCELIPPTSHVLPVPSCGTVDMKWDWAIYIDVLHGKKWTVSVAGK
jgi:hypothetical protein